MKLSAAPILAIFGLATAIPQADPPIGGPCETPGSNCTVKNVLENRLTKGNHIFCDLYPDTLVKPVVACEIVDGEGKEDLTETCNRNHGCINCQLSPGGIKMGGHVGDIVCDLTDKADIADIKEQVREKGKQKAQNTCEFRKLDERTCNATKLACINEAGPNPVSDDIAICVANKASALVAKQQKEKSG